LVPKPLCSNCKILSILTAEYQSNPWDSETKKRITIDHNLPLNLVEEWYKRMVKFDP
jgi:hypothetical protein